MTRFNITLDQSVKYVLRCINKMEGGELFVPKLQSYKVLDVAKVQIQKPKSHILVLDLVRKYMRN